MHATDKAVARDRTEEPSERGGEVCTMIDRAMEVAAKAHQGQVRKGTDVPYIAHPFSVGLILARAGCTDEVIAAGILHDTVEDTPLTLGEIRDDFGDTVADIVEGVSEPDKSLPWEDRKRHTIDAIDGASLDVLLVLSADKLHNVRTIASEYRRSGDKVWGRFKKGREAQAWYYASIADCLSRRTDIMKYRHLVEAYTQEVTDLFGSRSGENGPGNSV